MDDIVIGKVQSIQRCVLRAREEYTLAEDFRTDYSRQDAAVLNVTRVCEQTIDLANHLIRVFKLGVPTNSRESFAKLAQAGIIEQQLSEQLQGMVGFRNIAVHQYESLDLNITVNIIEQGLDDLVIFTKIALAFETNP